MSESPLAIRLFGPLEVRLRGEPLPRLPTRKIAWTLALLVLRRDRAIERDWLAGTLWPESAADRAHYNLRRGLSELRRALGSEAWRITTPNRHAVSLDLSGADVDLACFDEAIGRADAASLARAVAVYGGPLLEGCTEEWVLPEREAREQALLGALERLAAESLDSGAPASAVAYLRRAVAVDPLRESAQRLLLEALAAGGEHSEAVQSYRNLRLLLWEELRTEPAPETRAVHERIRAEAREHARGDTPAAEREGRPSAVAPAGPLPPIWNVPHRRNPSFVGREDLLSGIEAALAADGHAALTQAIVGLGGIGKTQCALEYAYRHAENYQTVWWVRAGEPAQLAADYAALAVSLDLPEKQASDRNATAAAVRRWLERRARWLLIFDNVPDPQAVMEYLPRAGEGHVLITSRDQNWGRTATTVPVPVLPQEEAVSFLEQRTGWSGPEVGVLAEELGQLPLALEQSAAYAEATGCSASAYLNLLRSRRRELLQHGGPLEGYQGTVATTWGLSMAETGAQCPAAAQLLNLCAYLAPDEILLSLIREGAEFYPEPLARTAQDPLRLHQAVAALRRYSLVTVHEEALTVHRLVQAVVRDGLSEEEERAYAARGVRLILSGFPAEAGDARTWPAYAPRLAHALAAADRALEIGVAPEETAVLLSRVGAYLNAQADSGQAATCLYRAVECIENGLGAEHPALIPRLEDLAHTAHWEARSLLERAVRIAEQRLGPVHPDLARLLAKLGDVTWEDELTARGHFMRALAIVEQTEGPDSQLAVDVDTRFAWALLRWRDFANGKVRAERALATCERVHPPNDPRVVEQHCRLAFVLGHLAEFDAEREHYERALVIAEEVYGPDHPMVGGILGNLGGWVLPAVGDLAGARACCGRAVAIQRRAFGPDLPPVAWALYNLAGVLWLQEELADAATLLQQAIAILGDDFFYHRLGQVQTDLGELGEAKASLERSIAVVKQWSGGEDDHPFQRDVLPDLGRVSRLQGNLEEARGYLERSLAIPEDVCPPHQRRMAATHLEYGLTLQAMGDFAGAREHLTQAVGMFERQIGPRHPRTEKARRALAALDPESVTSKRRRASRPPRAR